MEYLLVLIILLALFVWDKYIRKPESLVPGRHQAPDLIGDADRARRE